MVLIMFCSWKRFSRRVCNIQIRVYFTNIYYSTLDMVLDGVVAAFDVLGLSVKPGLLGYGNGSTVITEECHWTRRAWNHSKVGDELLHANSFMSCF